MYFFIFASYEPLMRNPYLTHVTSLQLATNILQIKHESSKGKKSSRGGNSVVNINVVLISVNCLKLYFANFCVANDYDCRLYI